MNRFPGLSVFAAAVLAAAIGTTGCSKSPEVTASTPTPTAGSGNVSDTDVTDHVKTALNQQPSLKGFDIKVVTLKGDVRLAGTLDSQTQIDDAIKVARAADGAHTIHNELTLKK